MKKIVYSETFNLPSFTISYNKANKVIVIELKSSIKSKYFLEIMDFAHQLINEHKLKLWIFDHTQGTISFDGDYLYFLSYHVPKLKNEGIKKTCFITPEINNDLFIPFKVAIMKLEIDCAEFVQKEDALDWLLK